MIASAMERNEDESWLLMLMATFIPGILAKANPASNIPVIKTIKSYQKSLLINC